MLMRIVALMLIGLAITSLTSTVARVEAAMHYICPPCSSPCDSKRFDGPGICPACGMALVEEGSVAAEPERKKVAILIFNGVEIIDYSGPFEMFGDAGFDVYTVALDKNPTTTAMGLTVLPKYTFADAPMPDVVVVPGGGVKATCDNAATLEWLKKASAHSEHTMSVCNGAFILASAGLLDGLKATTTAHNIDRMRPLYPKVKVVDDERVVDNGKMITAGGLSAGIDGALHVIDRMMGHGTAQRVALDQEYDWRPEGGYVRAALADMEIPRIDMDSMGDFQLVSTEGDRSRWEIVIRGSSKLSQAELMDRIGREFEGKGKWQSAGAVRSSSALAASDGASAASLGAQTSAWRFTGRDGKPWTGELTLEPAGKLDHSYRAKLTVARRG